MKAALFSAALFTLLTTSAIAEPQSTLEHDRAEAIRVDVLVSTATTAEAGLSTFAPDVVQDDFFPPQRHGIADVANDFGVYMANYSNFHADIRDMKADVSGDLAVVYSHQHFTAKGRNGTPDLDAMIRQTDVMHKINGEWKITYQHLSVPIDLKTGRAVFRP